MPEEQTPVPPPRVRTIGIRFEKTEEEIKADALKADRAEAHERYREKREMLGMALSVASVITALVATITTALIS